jgi:hypothetical protein
MRRPFSLLPAAVALVPGAALFVHLRLLGSDPAADAVLPRPPAAVRLRFSQRAEVAVTRVRLVGPNGPVALGPVERADVAAARASEIRRTPAGPTRGDDAVAVPIRGAMPPGAYTVEWRTMAADGHPVAGRVAFRVAAPR